MFPTMKVDDSMLTALLLLNNTIKKIQKEYVKKEARFTGYASLRSAVLDECPCIMLNVVIVSPGKKELIKKLPDYVPKGEFDMELVNPGIYQIAGIVEVLKKMYAVK
jgi:hypothetical protein